MKEFKTAVAEAHDEESRQSWEFAVDGVPCKAYRPKDGQIAVLMATTGRGSSNEEQIAGIINFFVSVLDRDSHSYLVSKLLNGEDEFGVSEVQDIIEWLIEEWTGRPTKSSSGSTQSRKTGGRKSTQPTPELT